MKKKFFAILLSLFLFPIFLISGCGGEAGKNSENANSMRHSKLLVIGIDEFAPMGFHDKEGNIVGFDVDLAKEAAKRMGVHVEFKQIDWADKERELESGNIDMIWNGLSIVPERKENILYSKPYMDNRQIILVKKGNPKNINSLGDLEGKIVGAQAGSSAEAYLNEDAPLKKSFAKHLTYQTVNEEFKALNDGECDALITDEIAARYEINKKPGAFEIVEVTVGPIAEFGVGFRKGNTELRDKVQKAFDDMIRDGTATRISEEWFQADLIKSRR